MIFLLLIAISFGQESYELYYQENETDYFEEVYAEAQDPNYYEENYDPQEEITYFVCIAGEGCQEE